MTEYLAKKIGKTIGYAIVWGFIFLLIMDFMGYDIVHEDNYHSIEYVEELLQENENLKYECNVLVAERDYAVASAYFLNTLSEKRNGDEYLYDVYIEAEPGKVYTSPEGIPLDMNYYYIDFLYDFCRDYADESISYKLSDDYNHNFDAFKTDYHFENFYEMLNTVEKSGQQHYDLEDIK